MKAKKIVWGLVILFLLFWLFSDPNGLADSAGIAFSKAWDLLTALFNGLIDFFDQLGN